MSCSKELTQKETQAALSRIRTQVTDRQVGKNKNTFQKVKILAPEK